MDLLDVARGPALWFALAVFVFGTSWRLMGVLRLPQRPDRSPPREGAPGAAVAALRSVMSGLLPRRGFAPATRPAAINGYVFHVGLALVFFGYAPHSDFVRRLTGLSWPALPDPVMYLAASVTIVSLVMAAVLRVSDPVLRRISGPDDWISWTVTFLPFVTGMAVATDPSAALLARDHVLYRGPLAVHLLTLELLLVWFPFGKLMHAVLFAFSRGATGIRFAHRGVSV
jgi:nitrate reductase gamma subunit